MLFYTRKYKLIDVQIELTRFRIKKGKEKKAQEWMDFLNQHHKDTVATMAGEKMYIETVFKEDNQDGYTYLYWYSIQGIGGMQWKSPKAILIKNI